ncbi:P-type DNA transfer protein VirB5 [Acidithiobacillus sp.]|uniref:P-type DNA transfer protein VirB5 n=1 Tax=Acidithiobacillus sp. TaxID=1872118 RepID=UPI00258F6515|nr:P-type DNA transfer protein VirB5 [Acidithiobacillus sp.]MDD5375059.1 P-type DNA transfer protein VirB5 [Acidithiobacillus sp.]
MKRIFLGVTLSALMSSAAFAQIPVTDGASIAQQVTAQIETIAKWKMQYDQMMSQIEQAKQQYESLTGSRGLGNIMNDPALRDYLPADWQGVYDSVRSGGYNGLSGRGASVYNANKIFDSCAYLTVDEQRTACEARAVKASQDKGFALDAYDAAKSRINQIDQLMAKINQTQDPKAIAELQGRIAAEQANIQNEQTKLQLYAMVAAAEEKVQAQRQREIQAKTWSADGMIKPKALTFGK